LTPSLYGGRRKLCGGLSEFDRQLFFKTALIALERAAIAALPHWLDAPHHHSGSATLAPGAPFDDLQRTRNKLGLGHGSSSFRRERYRALSHRRLAYGRVGDAAYSAFILRKSGQNGSLSKRAIAKEGCLGLRAQFYQPLSLLMIVTTFCASPYPQVFTGSATTSKIATMNCRFIRTSHQPLAWLPVLSDF
jgi:hypothetical protein